MVDWDCLKGPKPYPLETLAAVYVFNVHQMDLDGWVRVIGFVMVSDDAHGASVAVSKDKELLRGQHGHCLAESTLAYKRVSLV